MMPIVLEEEDGRPIVVCDVCQKRIVDAAEGNYEWLTDDKGHPLPGLFFTHKPCSIVFERLRSAEGSISAMELKYFPSTLETICA